MTYMLFKEDFATGSYKIGHHPYTGSSRAPMVGINMAFFLSFFVILLIIDFLLDAPPLLVGASAMGNANWFFVQAYTYLNMPEAPQEMYTRMAAISAFIVLLAFIGACVDLEPGTEPQEETEKA